MTPRFIIQISRGLIWDPATRRWVMFYSVLAALLLLFVGATFLWQWLLERRWWFVVYWGVCAWMTLLATLLSFFDMLLLRVAARRERRRIAREAMPQMPKDPLQ